MQLLVLFSSIFSHQKLLSVILNPGQKPETDFIRYSSCCVSLKCKQTFFLKKSEALPVTQSSITSDVRLRRGHILDPKVLKCSLLEHIINGYPSGYKRDKYIRYMRDSFRKIEFFFCFLSPEYK